MKKTQLMAGMLFALLIMILVLSGCNSPTDSSSPVGGLGLAGGYSNSSPNNGGGGGGIGDGGGGGGGNDNGGGGNTTNTTIASKYQGRYDIENDYGDYLGYVDLKINSAYVYIPDEYIGEEKNISSRSGGKVMYQGENFGDWIYIYQDNIKLGIVVYLTYDGEFQGAFLLLGKYAVELELAQDEDVIFTPSIITSDMQDEIIIAGIRR